MTTTDNTHVTRYGQVVTVQFDDGAQVRVVGESAKWSRA